MSTKKKKRTSGVARQRVRWAGAPNAPVALAVQDAFEPGIVGVLEASGAPAPAGASGVPAPAGASGAPATAAPGQPQCIVCTEFQFEPCTLSCGHTACFSCITRAFKIHRKCPICRRLQHDKPSINIDMREDVIRRFPRECENAKAAMPADRYAVWSLGSFGSRSFVAVAELAAIKRLKREVMIVFFVSALWLVACMVLPWRTTTQSGVTSFDRRAYAALVDGLTYGNTAVELTAVERDMAYTLVYFYCCPLFGLLSGNMRRLVMWCVWPATSGVALLPTIWSFAMMAVFNLHGGAFECLCLVRVLEAAQCWHIETFEDAWMVCALMITLLFKCLRVHASIQENTFDSATSFLWSNDAVRLTKLLLMYRDPPQLPYDLRKPPIEIRIVETVMMAILTRAAVWFIEWWLPMTPLVLAELSTLSVVVYFVYLGALFTWAPRVHAL